MVKPLQLVPGQGGYAPIAPWGTIHNLAAAEGAAARNTVVIDSAVVTLVATGNCYWRAGNASVTAVDTDYYLPANAFVDIPIGPNTHISVLSAAGSGSVAAQIVERSW